LNCVTFATRIGGVVSPEQDDQACSRLILASFGGEGGQTLRLNDTYNHNYFFVVPLSMNREGSYGVDSEHEQRPVGAAVCHERLIEECP